MGRTSKYKAPLENYALRASKVLSKSESVTSHLLLSYLFYLNDIHPWQIVPQPNSKRGIIDFFYLPKEEDYNVFVEMKKSRSLDTAKSAAATKYLRVKFPKALKEFGRKDGVRLLIVTDTRSISVAVRQKQWGSTSRGYALPLVSRPSVDGCASEIAKWLSGPAGETCRMVIWDHKANRWEAVQNELSKGRNSELYSRAYDKWLRVLRKVGGRGWPSRFQKAFLAKCDMTKKHVEPELMEAIAGTFKDEKIKSLAKKMFEQMGVTFKPGPMKSIF